LQPDTTRPTLIVEEKSFILDSLSKCVELAFPGEPIVKCPRIDAALTDGNASRAGLIVMSGSGLGREAQEEMVAGYLAMCPPSIPAVVFCESEDPERVVDLLARGIRGCISTSLSMDVIVQALRLVRAGGQFVPANCLIAAQRAAAKQHVSNESGDGAELFTTRQIAVIEALRKGKANKAIAYELNMCESTVKVHVRNIMKKLKARNRTEVAYLANELLRQGQGTDAQTR
jgi:DNA-binding NarL/FixJ family response regulator